MKKLVLLSLLIIPLITKAQTKILDSTIDWNGSSTTLLVFLSDDSVTSLQVKIGSAYGEDDLYNEELTEGTDFDIDENVIQIPLSGVTNSGDRFVWLNVVKTNTNEEDMAYKAN